MLLGGCCAGPVESADGGGRREGHDAWLARFEEQMKDDREKVGPSTHRDAL